MCFTCTRKQNLTDDDTRAVTQLYAPWTGWETGYAQGEYDRVAYARSVAGYYYPNPQPPGPEDSGVTLDMGVPVHSELRYNRLAGYALNSYSNVYFTLFTYENDESPLTSRLCQEEG